MILDIEVIQSDLLLDIHLIDGRRDPEHLAIRVDENVGLVSHLVVTVSTETGATC